MFLVQVLVQVLVPALVQLELELELEVLGWRTKDKVQEYIEMMVMVMSQNLVG